MIFEQSILLFEKLSYYASHSQKEEKISYILITLKRKQEEIAPAKKWKKRKHKRSMYHLYCLLMKEQFNIIADISDIHARIIPMPSSLFHSDFIPTLAYVTPTPAYFIPTPVVFFIVTYCNI